MHSLVCVIWIKTNSYDPTVQTMTTHLINRWYLLSNINGWYHTWFSTFLFGASWFIPTCCLFIVAILLDILSFIYNLLKCVITQLVKYFRFRLRFGLSLVRFFPKKGINTVIILVLIPASNKINLQWIKWTIYTNESKIILRTVISVSFVFWK